MARATTASLLDLARTPFTGRTERKASRFITAHELLAPGERVLLGVSGGPDSTALAVVVVARLRASLGTDFTIAHFDHMLRTRGDAEGDAEYVRQLAASLGVSATFGQGDVAGEARSKHTSREDAARRLRYAFLAGAAQDAGATTVAVGHTLDDRAETVLLHLLRGSGLRGLAGSEPSSAWPVGRGPRLVRPLLCLTRAETQRYCREVRIEPRLDPTNDLPVATRNRVRSRLMPILREFNPRVDEALVRLAEAAAVDADFLDTAARGEFDRLAVIDGVSVTLPRRDLTGLHSALQARLVVLAAKAAGSDGTVQGVHISDVLRLLSKRRGSVSVPGGLAARAEGEVLRIGPSQDLPAES